MHRSLDEIRRDIDHVDAEIIRLLDRRAGLAQEVGRVKGVDGQPFFTPERERAIFQKLESASTNILASRHLKAIFREIISAARDSERPLGIAFWGPSGSFSEMAAVEVFGRSVRLVACGSISEVFQAVENNQADYGVAPIENSSAGVVPETLDNFPQTNVKICAEAFIAIHHHLAGTGESLATLKRVYAGPQPAGQCRRWLQTKLPGVEIIDVTPTSRAAEMTRQDPDSAAIANRLCIERLGLTTLAEHIEDHSQNRTRFVVVGPNEPARTGSDKTSLMFNLRNRPGELHQTLGSFVRHGVNLMMIESRPAPRAAFEYLFYVDCAGHQEDDHVAACLKEIKESALEVVILGSYPSTDPHLVA